MARLSKPWYTEELPSLHFLTPGSQYVFVLQSRSWIWWKKCILICWFGPKKYPAASGFLHSVIITSQQLFSSKEDVCSESILKHRGFTMLSCSLHKSWFGQSPVSQATAFICTVYHLHKTRPQHVESLLIWKSLFSSLDAYFLIISRCYNSALIIIVLNGC